jgi:polyferredoxin
MRRGVPYRHRHPQGPDIACITCALCIDACDKVMADDRPPARADRLCHAGRCRPAKRRGAPPTWHMKLIWHPRTLVYSAVWSGDRLRPAVRARRSGTHRHLGRAKDRNPPFMLLSDGSVRNAYTLKLRNMESRPRTCRSRSKDCPVR